MGVLGLPLIRPSGTFSHKGRRHVCELSAHLPSPSMGEGGESRMRVGHHPLMPNVAAP